MISAPSTPRLTLRLGRFCYLALNVAVVVFLLAPIAIVFVFALNPTPYIQFPPVGVSLRWFEKFFASRDFMNALWLSLEVAAMTTIAATLFGASAALALARGGLPGSRVITAIMLSPLMLPAILTGLALFQSYVLLDVGRPLWGLVLGHTLVSIPYVVRTTLAVLQNFDTRLEEAACNLGAGPLRTYFRGDAAVDQARRHGGSRVRLHRLLRPVSGIAFPGLSGPRNAADHACSTI